MGNLPAATRLDSGRAFVKSYRPTSLTLIVEAPDRGWLLVTDSWSAGWSATVNGQPAAVWGGNFIFRAVPVRAGTNAIEFQFTAFGFPWLLGLSWGTLAVVAVLSARLGEKVARVPVLEA
jgi:uncharacterized membrane protein YfhO